MAIKTKTVAGKDILRLKAPEFAAIYELNPGFDILHHDFFDNAKAPKLRAGRAGKKTTALLAEEQGTLERLKQYQRVLRIHPDESVAKKLLRAGLDSAHKITSAGEHEFVHTTGAKLKLDAETAREVFRNAEDVKQRSALLYMNIRDRVSPFYKATLGANTSPELSAKYESIPGYTDLFGTLDYCACAHCRSILSPAAYFTDLMSLANQYITVPNTATIPTGMTLKSRRPDLFHIPLDCDHTNRLVPYIQIVNGVMEKKLSVDLQQPELMQYMANALYPFNAPFNKPLAQIRSCLQHCGSSLADVYAIYGSDAASVARERLQLSREQYKQITTANADPVSLSNNYGTTITASSFGELGKAHFFARQTGMPSIEKVKRLVYENLDASEQTFPQLLEQFFINSGTPGKHLSLSVNKTDPANEYLQIDNLSLDALDRVNRFMRLATALGWDFADLDAVLQSLTPKAIDENAIRRLAVMVSLMQQYPTDVQTVVSFYSDMKTSGIGSLAQPEDLFDRVYNYPTTFYYKDNDAERKPYHPVYALNPSYKTAVVNWLPYDQSVNQSPNANARIRSRFIAALRISDDDVTALAGRIIRILDIKNSEIPMTVPNMTLFYRFSKQASLLGLTIPDYLALLDMQGWQQANTLENFLAIAAIAGWMKASGFNVYELQFIATGLVNKYVNVAYQEKEIKRMLEDLRAQAQSWMVSNTSFTYEDMDDNSSAEICVQLRANAAISEWGICLGSIMSFAAVSNLVQLRDNSFITNLIDPNASKTTFAALTTNKILVNGYLAADFTAQTNLDFLFTGDPLKSDKTEQVRSMLTEIKRLMQLIAATVTSFISANISAAESAAAFADLVSHNILEATGTLKVAVTDATDLSFLFPAEKDKRELMIVSVKNQLMEATENISYIQATWAMLKTLQSDGTVEQLSNFFNTATDLMNPLLKMCATITAIPDVILLLLTPATDLLAPVPDKILKLVQCITQNLFALQKIRISATELESILAFPASYGMNAVAAGFYFSIPNLVTLSGFKQLEAAFNDTSNGLINFFATPADAGKCVDSKKMAMLAKISGWKQEQICFLVEKYIPNSGQANSVASIQWLKSAFDQSGMMNVDVYFMSSLTALAQMDATTANWGAYLNYVNSLFDIANANVTDEQWKQVYDKMSAPVWEAERNVLVDYMIWYLAKPYPWLKTPDDLYQFLLIDVEMGACMETSYIKEGISAVQLYIQRCRMNLEAGIVSLEIREIWWEWMASYRVWEANRKVFLYPENYIDPDLRKNKSPIFQELKDELMQGDITEDRVTEVYMSYFDKLCNLSNLVVAGSYFCEVNDPEWGLSNNLWLFGRTADSPYSYYYRRAMARGDGYFWEPWKKIDISIGGAYITPVYSMNKLFIFWAETDGLSGSTFENGTSKENKVVKATIKYSYYNFNEQWVQPQTLRKDVVTYYYPDLGYIAKIQGYIDKMNINLAQDNLFWKKPYPIDLPATDTEAEKVLVLFGDIPNLPPSGKPAPPVPDTEKATAAEIAFNDMLYNSIDRAVKATNEGLLGYAGMPEGGVLSPNLRDNSTNIILQNYNTIPGSPVPYRGFIDVDKATLSVGQTNNVLYDNYMGDSVSKIGQPNIPSGTPLPLLSNVSQTNSSIMMVKNMPGWFSFDNGDETYLSVPDDKKIKEIRKILAVNTGLSEQENETDLLCLPYTDSKINFTDLKFKFLRLSTVVPQQLSYKLFAGGISNLLTIASQQTKEIPFNRFYPNGVKPASVIAPATDQLDFNGAYGPYFWEVFFYIPFQIANSLSDHQRFEEAQKWYQYLFNPTTREQSAGNDRYWGFLPFWGQTPESLDKILTDPAQIAVYNNDPFDPDAIAHLRITAFQKALVMKYINNLIKWADNLFEQDTWEAIIEATMLYVMAKDLLGERPKIAGTCEQEKTADFQDILDKYGNNIPEFLIQLENAVKPAPKGTQLSAKPYNDISAYFCVGENEVFTGYWSTIEDRLFKIRHCMNIYGQERQLALFEPPLNPMDLVKAFASGGNRDVTGVLSALSPKVPEYRFSYILAQARNVTSSVIQLGTSLLGALEKKDGEHLALIRQVQESTILNMTLRLKEEQLDQATANLAALGETYKSAQNRLDYYTNLITVGLIPTEVLHIQATILANILNVAGSVMKISSSLAHLVPNVGSPFAMTYGGNQVGSSLDAVGAYFDLLATVSNFAGSLSLTMAGYQRREQEWKLQQKTAEYDINNITYQIQAAQVAQAMARQEIDIQKKQIQQNKEVEAFYRTKFTNEELYQWIINRLSSLYFQTYKLAFDLSLAAEKAYQYERNSSTRFIEYGYWDSLKKGLCSGEALQLSLSQLENAYTNEGKRPLQIQKSISLLQHDPIQLLNLKNTGACYFELNEKLFDLDYPGQYRRQLKSVSITIPAVVGPYQNIKATLTQMSNKIILKPDLNAVNFLLGDENANVPDNSVLRANWKASQQIAISTGVNDSGMFQLNFGDERYLPFEGTGAVSSWKLEMPKATNAIDFDSISDIIIQLSYEASGGDEGFKNSVKKLPALASFQGYQLLNLAQQYAPDWFAFMNPAATATEQVLYFAITPNMFRSNLSAMKISEVTLMLKIYSKATYSGKLPVTLDILDQPLKYNFEAKNPVQHEPVPAVITEYYGKWKIVIKKADIPQGLQNTNGFLDITKVENIGALISYSGNMNWM